ncbi:MAG TPA: class I SAM-dependent methyltransferase [Candidatus Sumerlaeota bacterium]|nr:class I SAM-dependent methyltransferase [Candidatus Sumerlaeota bacterium]HOR26880.1 class I SAM-dependent methyltransferase [Candidatus Sumerlaeota bacterium]HPK01912.1 class I SAM-dependent methyltransferase [Candidatus Sumerlaeota bacterium]
MEHEEYQRMFALEDRHWWFQGRLMMIERLLRRHVLPVLPARPRLLDLGCGTGLFLQRRLRECEPFGIDFSVEALACCRTRVPGRLARADAARLPFADAVFDVVSAFDLIEHVADDVALVAEAWRVLRPGGCFIATVPAHPILWSAHDVSLHHQRRYRRAQFNALFNAAPWETIRMTAGFTLIFPPALLIRLGRRLARSSRPPVSDTRETAEWLNRLLIRLHAGEAAWLERHDLPIGISLMTIRRKPEARP